MLKCEHFIDSIYYQLEQTAKYCRYLGMQLFQKLDLPINLDEFVVLDTLLGHEGICQRDLAKLILKDRPSTGRLLNSLEEKGLILRSNETKNGRQVRKTSLTDEGNRIYEKICKELDNNFENMTKFFDGKEKKLISYLDEIKEIITEGEKVTFD